MGSLVIKIGEALKERSEFYEKEEGKYDSNHIFIDMINHKKSYNNKNEKILLFMIFHNCQNSLLKLKTKNYSYADYFMSRSKGMINLLESSQSKTVSKCVFLPLSAFKYYAKEEYESAKEELMKSFPHFEHVFDLGVNEAVWAKLEQYLNLIRILINQEKHIDAFALIKKVITTFLGNEYFHKPFINVNEKMYLSLLTEIEKYKFINHFIDSVIFKINHNDDLEQRELLINSVMITIKKADGYNYLNNCITSYLNNSDELLNSFMSLSKTNYILPRSIEGLLLKKISSNSNNQDIKNLIKTYSSKMLNITFNI